MKWEVQKKVAFAALLFLGAGACRETPAPANPSTPPREAAPLFKPYLADALLEAPDRDRWQKPAEIVRALNLAQGARVADIGTGSGYLLPYLCAAVGKRGTVYAEEVQGEFLAALLKRKKRLPNIEIVLGTEADPQLPEPVDCFVLLTVYHEVQNPVAFLKRLHTYTRPDGRLAIIDFDARRNGDPPAPEGHELPEATVLKEAEQAGWVLADRHEFLSSQFFLVFKAKP